MSESISVGNLVLTPVVEQNTAAIQAQLAQIVGQASAQARITVGLNLGNSSASLSGLEFQILGLTDAVKSLGSNLGSMAQQASQAGSKAKAGLSGVDLSVTEAARSVRTLLTEFQNGGVSADVFSREMLNARGALELMRTENSLGTRELQLISSTLNTAAKAYGEANTAASPYLVGLKEQKAAAQSLSQTSAALNSEILQTRRAWQEGSLGAEQMDKAMQSLYNRSQALLAPLEAQKAAILGLGVPTREEAVQLERLTLQMNGLSMASQRAAAGIDAANNRITRGSLAAGVQAGVAGLSGALKVAVADTERLMNAERAGLLTKEQYTLALAGQTAAHRASLLAVESEALGLRELGVLDVQQTARLEQLMLAQNGYTASLARTVGAQQAAANAQRAAAGAALGMRGAGGMNNAAMGAMFISPELGMAAMALSMGPVIAGALAVGVFIKTLGDGVGKAAAFQRSLQQIGAISGQSAREMNQFGSYIQHLSTELPISTAHLAEMGREAVMVGLHGPEGMRIYTQNMAAFAIITRTANGELGHTAEVGQEVVKILRSTGASTHDVEIGFGRMINGLVGLKTESGVAIPQVTALLKFWSSQGSAVGLTIEQMTGLSAALIQTGARAQGAGGAMAKFFDTAESAAASGGKKLQAFADVLGISAEKAHELLKQDPMGFLTSFITGAQRMTGEGKALSLTLGSVGLNSAQVRRTMAELNNALPLVTGNIRIMTEASNDQGLALRKAVDATNDYKDKVALLGQGFDLLKTNMGMAVLPGMTAVLAWALDLSKALQHASDYLSGGLGGAAGINTSRLSAADLADVELTLKSIEQLQTRTDAASVTELKSQQAHLAVLKSIADGSLVGTAPWLKTPMNVVGAGNFSTPIGVFNGSGPLAPGQVRGAGATEAGNLAIQASLSRTGDKLADSVVDYCAKWVRMTLGKASPAAAQINKLFQTDYNKDGKVTAIDASRNAEQAGILQKYTKPTDLAPGDTVFYTEGGQNHVGLYIGNGMVRGNNRVSMSRTGNPVGDVSLSDLGTPSGFVRASSYLGGGNKAASGPTEPTGPNAAAYLKEAERIQNAITAAQKQGGAAGLAAYTAATKQLQAFTKDNKDAAAAVAYLATQTKAAGKIQKEADTDAAQIRKSLAQGNVTDAQTTLEKLRTIQQAQLDDAGSSQARRLAVVKQTSGQIYAAELAIADATRKASVANVADEKNPDVKAQAQTSADKTYALAKQKAVLAQAQALTAAQKSADTEAEADQKKHDQALKDQAKTRADTMKALREDDVKAAQANLNRLKEVQDRALALDRDNLVKQLADRKAYAKQVHDLQVQINQAQYDQAVKDANNGRAQQRPGLLRIAQTNLNTANLAAQNTQNETVRTATDAVTSAVQKQRDAYSKLADGLRQNIEAGTLDSAARQKALEEFNALGRATEALGLTNNDYVRGARAATFALVGQAVAAYLVAQRAKGMTSGNDDAAASALQLAADLASMGDTEGQLAVLQNTYDNLTASLARSEVSAGSVDKVRLALEALQGSLGTESALSDWLSTLDGSIDDQLAAITEKLRDPNTTTAFRKALFAVAQGYGEGTAVTGGMGEAASQAVADQSARNIGEARNLIQNLTEATGGTLQDVMARAAALLTSEIGKNLPTEIRDSIQAGIDGAKAGMASLSEVLADPSKFADGSRGAAKPPEAGDVAAETARTEKLFADTQSRTAAHIVIEQQQLDRAHTDGLVSQAGYISQRQMLSEQGAQTEFETRTRGLKESEPAYKQAEETLQAALTAAAAEGTAARKGLQTTEASNFLMSAQRRLTLAQRDGQSTAGPRAEVGAGLSTSIAAARTELSAMNPLADGYMAKLTAIQGLEDQLRDVQLSATLQINGLDTGIAAIQTMTSAAATLGQSLSSHFEKVAQGSESMSQAVTASVAEMTVSVIKNLEQQIIATEVAALATDLLSGNFVKAAIDVGIIAAVGIGGGLATGLLGGSSGAPTMQNPSSGAGSSTAASAASSAPAITYSLTLNNSFAITEGLDSPGTRQKLAAMQEQTALQIMDRAGLIRLPAASPTAGA